MRLLWILFISAGCVDTGTFDCKEDDQCGAGGVCEPNGSCSFTDPDCPNGRRYGAFASAGRKEQCVEPGDAGVPDGGSTTTPCVTALAAATDQVCSIREEETAWCWGDNSVGQLGRAFESGIITTPLPVISGVDGRLLDQVQQIDTNNQMSCVSRFTQVWCWGAGEAGAKPVLLDSQEPLSAVDAIGLGGSHRCARRSSGEVWCWGTNTLGQLGRGTTSPTEPFPAPVMKSAGVALSNVKQMAVGGSHTCVLLPDALLCWGEGGTGQLGNGNRSEQPFPVSVSRLDATEVKAVRSGINYSCAVMRDGFAWCWGNNANGQLGTGSTSSGRELEPVQVMTADGSFGGVEDLFLGDTHVCALKEDRTVWCWGSNAEGQIGGGSSDDPQRYPIRVQEMSDALTITAGRDVTCATRADAVAVHCWGTNRSGQLGRALSSQRSPVPVPIESDCSNTSCIAASTITALELADNHGCVIAGGRVSCWGAAELNRLGNDSSAGFAVAPVSATENIVSLSGGGGFMCSVDSNQQAVCWGDNSEGQLGNDSIARGPSTVVTGSGPLPNVTAVSAGLDHACALTDGTVWCWGNGGSGRLGNGEMDNSRVAVQVVATPGGAAFTGVAEVAAGSRHTCLRKTDKTVWCFGNNGLKQLGDTTTTTSAVPVQVIATPALNAEQVVAGDDFTCARRSDGEVWCWGSSANGVLGAGEVDPTMAPVAVTKFSNPGSPLSDVSAISTMYQHVCALSNGAVWCWGNNGSGRLGDQTTNERNRAVKAAMEAPIASITTGREHTCAQLTDGNIRCWGNNRNGQVGKWPESDAEKEPTPVGWLCP